jgi:hypothetical protein
MTGRLIRITTALAVATVATVAAVISYRHAYELVSTHGETVLTARLVPFTVDGLILAASMLILDAGSPAVASFALSRPSPPPWKPLVHRKSRPSGAPVLPCSERHGGHSLWDCGAGRLGAGPARWDAAGVRKPAEGYS